MDSNYSNTEDRSSYMRKYYQRNREIILRVAKRRYKKKAEQKWKQLIAG